METMEWKESWNVCVCVACHPNWEKEKYCNLVSLSSLPVAIVVSACIHTHLLSFTKRLLVGQPSISMPRTFLHCLREGAVGKGSTTTFVVKSVPSATLRVLPKLNFCVYVWFAVCCCDLPTTYLPEKCYTHTWEICTFGLHTHTHTHTSLSTSNHLLWSLPPALVYISFNCNVYVIICLYCDLKVQVRCACHLQEGVSVSKFVIFKKSRGKRCCTGWFALLLPNEWEWELQTCNQQSHPEQDLISGVTPI